MPEMAARSPRAYWEAPRLALLRNRRREPAATPASRLLRPRSMLHRRHRRRAAGLNRRKSGRATPMSSSGSASVIDGIALLMRPGCPEPGQLEPNCLNGRERMARKSVSSALEDPCLRLRVHRQNCNRFARLCCGADLPFPSRAGREAARLRQVWREALPAPWRARSSPARCLPKLLRPGKSAAAAMPLRTPPGVQPLLLPHRGVQVCD